MNRLISDLLDSYGEEKIRFKKAPAVNPDRIYALANTKAGKENVFMEKRHRRLPVALAVVVAAVLLMGAGFVVAHNSITDYFVRQWEGMTDTEITDEHLATIESFSQEIGISETQGQDMTVTVDSVTFTDERLYALIKVESRAETQPLLHYDFNIYGNFADNSSCGVTYDGIHEDGAAYYVASLVYNYIGEPDATEVDVTLVIENPNDENAQSWEFCFTLERTSSDHINVISEGGEPITVTVSMESLMDSMLAGEAIYQEITRDVTAITLFESGMYVTYDNETAIVTDGVDQYDIDSIYWDTNAVFAIMHDGTTVPVNYTSYTPVEGSTTSTVEYLWLIPVNLDEVASIRIGDTDIEVG